jgi:hypothetical protein
VSLDALMRALGVFGLYVAARTLPFRDPERNVLERYADIERR